MTPPLRLEIVTDTKHDAAEVDRLKAITIKHIARRLGQSDMPRSRWTIRRPLPDMDDRAS